jgi:5-methylcytosine-specific restriction endonuclease McrA
LSDRAEKSVPKNHVSVRTRIIPSDVKRDVFKRDQGKCVICGDSENIHFDHDLPYVHGGTSLSAKNVRILCMKHNLQKSDKIE